MKTLARFLAEYIEQESYDGILPTEIKTIEEWMQAGIEAFESTQNCTVDVEKK